VFIASVPSDGEADDVGTAGTSGTVWLPTFLPDTISRACRRGLRCPAARTREEHAVVQAFILVQTEVGKAAAVANAIADIAGVVSAEDVTGPYDVIVRAEAGDVDELGQLVVAKVQSVNGITRTLTCPVVNLG
jgi:DNA-binding Lrp family transcriptional regulator